MIAVGDTVYCPGLNKGGKFFAYKYVVKAIEDRADGKWYQTSNGWLGENLIFTSEIAARQWAEGVKI